MKNKQSANQHRQNVKAYYDQSTYGYMIYGKTFQCALLDAGEKSSSVLSNLYFLVKQAGIIPGDRVLDAGCGIGGPSIDLANFIDDLEIHAITISYLQANLAKQLIHKNQLNDQIHVYCGDFHELPFPDQYFDIVYFLESACYSDNLSQLFSEVYRVLRPGGTLYIKDAYINEDYSGQENFEDIKKVNNAFATNLLTRKKTVEFIEGSGFQVIRNRDIVNIINSYLTSRDVQYKMIDGYMIPTISSGQTYWELLPGEVGTFAEIFAKKL